MVTQINLAQYYLRKSEIEAAFGTDKKDAQAIKDAIDEKININDIKDNLTSTDTNKPLSANQGKTLKTLVDGKATSTHTHGNLLNDGSVGTTNNTNKNVVTDANGKITTENKPTIPTASSTATDIKMNGTQSAGTSSNFAKADHVHPTDTSRAPLAHAVNATTYGLSTSGVYGHTKIIQNLTTDDGNGLALGAGQGKALKTLVDGKADSSHTHTKSQITDFSHTHDDRYYTESEMDTKLANKSKVSFTQTKTSGIEIGTINIDGTDTKLYQQDNNTTYTAASATPKVDSGSGTVGTSAKYAREDHVHPSDTTKNVTLTKLSTATTGYVATYEIKQGTTSLGKIDIPKDYLVKSGSVKTVSTANSPVSGYVVGDKYIDFIINTKTSDGTDEHIYVNTKDLLDDATQSRSGLMSAADKQKLDGMASGGATATDHNHDGSYIKTGTGTVTSTNIADGTIVNGDIANTTIQGGKLVNGTITATQLASNAVETAKIKDANVTNAKLADQTNIVTEYIVGTQTASTSAWTGKATKLSSLAAGQVIYYKLPYASTSTSVTLNLTLANGSTTTGAKNVFFWNGQRLTTHYGVNSVVGLIYNGSEWWVINPSTNGNNNNYYLANGVTVTNGESSVNFAASNIIGAKKDGKYYKIVNGLVLDVSYPIVEATGAINAGATNNNTRTVNPFVTITSMNITYGTITSNYPLYLEGTAYSKGQFTVSNNSSGCVVCDNSTHSTLTNGRYYICLGTTYDATHFRFISDMTVYRWDGTNKNMIPIGASYTDLADKPSSFTPSSHTHGNITNAGAIGSTANLPIITDTNGVLKTGSFGTAANTFCQGNDSRLSNTRTPTAHATTTTTYGGGTASNYGHVKVSDNTSSSAGNASQSVAASSAAVKSVYDIANPLKERYDGKFISGVATVNKPYLRLFNLKAKNSDSSSSHIIFEIIGNNNDRLYAKIRVDMRQNNSTTNSSYTVTPLEVYGFNLDELYFGFRNAYPNTSLDIFRKVGAYVNFYIRYADDHTRDGTVTMYSPVVNSTESYTDLTEAATTLYSASYTATSQGGTYTEVTNTIPYTNVNANKFVKRGGTSSQFLKADGSVDETTYVATGDSRLSNARTPTAHTDSNGAYGKATTSVWGHTKLSSATNSSAEDIAATPKAVKAAYDLANGKANASHTHGNITNAGAIGSTANLPIITDTNGVLKTGSFGTAANTFCQGNDSRLSNTRTPTDNTVSTGKIVNGAVTGAKIADETIESGKIKNGTIVDADISSSAAIATSKISGLDTALSGKAPTSHASTATTYGVATTSNYGHTKIIQNLTTSDGNGLALGAGQGKTLNTKINESNMDIFPSYLSSVADGSGTYSAFSIKISNQDRYNNVKNNLHDIPIYVRIPYSSSNIVYFTMGYGSTMASYKCTATLSVSDYPEGTMVKVQRVGASGTTVTVTKMNVENDNTISRIANMIYPIGSIYTSVSNVSPAILFGGTWEQLQNRFLLGAGSSYTAGDTGGEATHTLNTSEMPSHNHGHYWKRGNLTTNSNGNTHYLCHSDNGGTLAEGGNGITTTGSGGAHNNMPPYLVVYMWKRTA